MHCQDHEGSATDSRGPSVDPPSWPPVCTRGHWPRAGRPRQLTAQAQLLARGVPLLPLPNGPLPMDFIGRGVRRGPLNAASPSPGCLGCWPA